MFYLIIGVAIVWVIISTIKEEGGFISKLVLSTIVAAVACLLLKWITDWEFMLTLAKICGATAVLATLIGVIKRIVE